MPQRLDELQQSANNWLLGEDFQQLIQLTEQLYSDLSQWTQQGIVPKVLIAEQEPVKFLAGFIAASAASCPVFLSNPYWVQQEWQQVFKIVQPGLILGCGDWGLEINNYYPNSGPFLNPNWVMIPTGGSSGKIRFAIHTWETLTASVAGFQQYFQLQEINSFCTLPLYHVSGIMQFMRSFTTNGKLIIQPFKQLETNSFKAPVSDFFISLVPTQLQRLLEKPDTAKWLSKFKAVLLGGAPAWQELLERAREYQINLALTYGMTETASGIAILKPEDFLKGESNCGQILPHSKVSICNDVGEKLKKNEVGNIAINSQSLALGYYPNLFENREDFRLDDLGFIDSKGYLNLVGRRSNKIITGGENVYPIEVEAAIRATNLVKDVCVVGASDRLWGQVVIAIYVKKEQKVSATKLQIVIANKLSKYKQPKQWIAVEQIPRNSQGKVNYKQTNAIVEEYLKVSNQIL
ncbi:2-succinylbenzoate--CoA ligase [Chlorogloea sp. CCALA 695]|uniref:2-succinylbenzoate--CoA ligase n=1 Tax=Chlorogloea sp. CCALA 695 TaxID=2107693 RepID=UPI000D05450E|nr:2-succinylbenzoate--CoA ligase [Chlorogloea sp. CCALA 695]PSB27589.1 2-succinylbenzoate-CoA ligase [Chlorogloea sp. CCALA 695]